MPSASPAASGCGSAASTPGSAISTTTTATPGTSRTPRSPTGPFSVGNTATTGFGSPGWRPPTCSWNSGWRPCGGTAFPTGATAAICWARPTPPSRTSAGILARATAGPWVCPGCGRGRSREPRPAAKARTPSSTEAAISRSPTWSGSGHPRGTRPTATSPSRVSTSTGRRTGGSRPASISGAEYRSGPRWPTTATSRGSISRACTSSFRDGGSACGTTGSVPTIGPACRTPRSASRPWEMCSRAPLPGPSAASWPASAGDPASCCAPPGWSTGRTRSAGV